VNRQPIELKAHLLPQKKVNVIGAVSIDNGIEGMIVTRDSVNSIIFVDIIRQIARKGNDALIIMDGVGYHKSGLTKQVAGDLGIEILINLPYTPILNPIEKVWLMAKTYYR